MTTLNEVNKTKVAYNLFGVYQESERGYRDTLATLTWLKSENMEYDRTAWNQLVIRELRRGLHRAEAHKMAEIECINKGHDWHVRSQAAHDAGYDEPVHCWRCGAWDM